jgi:hypothetical protein
MSKTNHQKAKEAKSQHRKKTGKIRARSQKKKEKEQV